MHKSIIALGIESSCDETSIGVIKVASRDNILVSNSTKIEKEFGDVLFSLINYARFIGVDPESALERTNKKFISRFSFLGITLI